MLCWCWSRERNCPLRRCLTQLFFCYCLFLLLLLWDKTSLCFLWLARLRERDADKEWSNWHWYQTVSMGVRQMGGRIWLARSAEFMTVSNFFTDSNNSVGPKLEYRILTHTKEQTVFKLVTKISVYYICQAETATIAVRWKIICYKFILCTS